MSEIVNIQSPLSYLRGILFGTSSSDPTKGETVDVTTGAAHVKISDEAGADHLKDVKKVVDGGDEYELVAASQTNAILGSVGAVGDLLGSLICVVSTAATAQVQIKDGSETAITVFPNSPGGGVGTYVIPLGLRSRSGAWQITTGAGVSVLPTGIFS